MTPQDGTYYSTHGDLMTCHYYRIVNRSTPNMMSSWILTPQILRIVTSWDILISSKSWFSSMLISWSHVVFMLMSCCDCVISCCCIVISCFVNIAHFVKNVNFVIFGYLQHHHNCIIFRVSFNCDFDQGWICYLRSIWMIQNYLIFLCFLFLLCLHVMLCISCLYLFKVPTLLMVNFVIFGYFVMLAICA